MSFGIFSITTTSPFNADDPSEDFLMARRGVSNLEGTIRNLNSQVRQAKDSLKVQKRLEIDTIRACTISAREEERRNFNKFKMRDCKYLAIGISFGILIENRMQIVNSCLSKVASYFISL